MASLADVPVSLRDLFRAGRDELMFAAVVVERVMELREQARNA